MKPKKVKNLAKNRESFRAFVVEVCEVNIGRLWSLGDKFPDEKLYFSQLEESLINLKKTAQTNEYPGHV